MGYFSQSKEDVDTAIRLGILARVEHWYIRDGIDVTKFNREHSLPCGRPRYESRSA